MMQREDESAREEFSYTHIPTLERASTGGTLGRRMERERDRVERDSYIVDVRASDLDLDQAETLHPCFSYRAWLYSILIGCSLLITAGFSLYLGNVFPDAMDYLRCAAGASIPAAVVSFAIATNWRVAVSDFQLVYVSTFAVTTTCLVWFGCKLVISPSAVNINFNLILLTLLEALMASTVILSARSVEDCCSHNKQVNDGPVSVTPAKFPSRLLKAYAVVEVIVGISAVLGGIIALNMDALLSGPYVSVTLFWVLVACFPSAIASHVVSEYPSKCTVETLIAISSLTSPLLFSASGFLSNSVLNFIDIFQHEVPAAKAGLTLATVVHCASYKGQLRIGGPEWDDNSYLESRQCEGSNGTLREFDKDKAWKAVVVQMAQ
ncbi:Membrane protein MLC1 [Bagarius yarrelli]|uniref:Membrane protein MLC1 n=1 Tax=Bagarius yarrelli TaxID=175774 RepID=A0A556TQV5_BAGYA|nr:Membrane protein MLC1 [Bagarius yarrelli]